MKKVEMWWNLVWFEAYFSLLCSLCVYYVKKKWESERERERERERKRERRSISFINCDLWCDCMTCLMIGDQSIDYDELSMIWLRKINPWIDWPVDEFTNLSIASLYLDHTYIQIILFKLY